MADAQRRLTRALVATSLLLTGFVIAPRVPGSAASTLEYLGNLPQSAGAVPTEITLVDAAHRRAYGHRLGAGTITEYDLDRPVAKMKLREAPLPSTVVAGNFSPNQVALDSQHRRVFYLDWTGQDTTCPYQSLVRSLDLVTLKAYGAPWDLNVQVPGFYAEGITYSATDHRIYLVGSLGCEAFLAGSVQPAPVLPVVIVALDADSGKLQWTKTLSKCLHNMTIFSNGGAIFRSDHFPALYVGCMRPDAPFGVAPFPGQAGILRLWIDPHGGLTAPAAFREELFAISGSFMDTSGANGQLLYDPHSERLMLATHSETTPGIWVLDGIMSAWVGFIPAEDGANSPIGLDTSTGHIYMRSGNLGGAPLIVADTRQTPVPQGRSYHLNFQIPGTYFWIADPVRHLVFAMAFERQKKGGSRTYPVVLRDTIPSGSALPSIDYDSLTSDVPESASTISAFSGTSSGYGVNFEYIGGVGGTTAPAYQNPFTQNANLVPRNSAISAGDRGVALSVLPSIDLRNVGASATAQEVTPDISTDDDRRTYQGQVAQKGEQAGLGDAAQQVAAQMDWPWPAATCLDAGGKAIDAGGAQQGGEAAAHCNLAKERASASASTGVENLDGVTVAGSSISSETFRGATGIVTKTVSRVRGLSLDVPGSGSLRIGSIELHVQTVAHGRSRTAHVTWAREISGAVLDDAQGHEVFSCSVCDADELAAEVNDLFGLKVRMHVPEPQIAQTPHGAYAGFSKTVADYVNDLTALNDTSRAMPALQLEVYNDYQDRSRFLVQLAGIASDSIYGISMLPTDNVVTPPVLPLPKIKIPRPPVPVATNATVVTPPASSSSLIHRLITSTLLLVRSPKDALLIALTALLFFGAIVISARRRRLLALMNGRSGS
jgi:hypothetical protein